MKISIISFNCRSIKRSCNSVTDLCEKYDIIALQEHWLIPDDLGYLDKIHPDFSYHGVSAVDMSAGVLKGRPYGGTAILWRTSLFNRVIPIDTGSTRVAAVCVQVSAGRSFIVMSVYMPTQDVNNLPLFTECLGVISAVIESSDVESVLVLGDFNADASRPNSLFGSELLEYCDDQDWLCADINLLGMLSNTYTYLSDSHGTTSWLDHCVTTSAGFSMIDSICVLNDVYYSDHFPLLVECNVDVVLPKTDTKHNQLVNKVIWGQRTYEQNCKYAKLCNEFTQSYSWSDFSCNGTSCKDSHHCGVIDKYYKQIVNIMSRAAKLSYQGKSYIKKRTIVGWNYHVRECHGEARQSYTLWNLNGRPSQGKMYDDMIRSKKVFKNKIKWCQSNENKIKMDIIATHRRNKQFGKFWSETNKLNYKASVPVNINGCNDPGVIANMFAKQFNPVTSSTVANNVSVDGVARGGSATPPPRLCEKSDHDTSKLHVTAEELYLCVKGMKRGKSPGHDGLSVEHFMYAPESLFIRVSELFNACVDHGFLPDSFLRTIVVPIVKNRTGDVSSLTNYRPISLATIFSKIFERLIISHLSESNFPINNAQFGFREGMSTDLAIFSLKNTVYKYLQRNTSVYACFLDLSRAFDSINYKLLWDKLRNPDSKVPSRIVDLLEYWYANQCNQVRWNSALSDTYRLTCGVRQGGLTSPILFNMYTNQLIEELSSTRAGCRIGDVSVNNLSYADDMVLLSPSANGLRRLVAICEKYAAEHYLTYNVKKSEVMIFRCGKGPDNILPINLCGTALSIVHKFKYLGHIIRDDLSDEADLERQRRSIACRSNMLARRFSYCSNQVKVTLFTAYCQSFYTSQLWYRYTKFAYNTLRVQYNNAFRAILKLPWRCSATGMFVESRVTDFYGLMRRLRASFQTRLCACNNLLVSEVFNCVYLLRPELVYLML